MNKIQTFTKLDIINIEEKPTLWVFGCSHSYGFGLKPDEKSFAKLIAEQLDMPLKLVAKPASSTNYSLRHLVNANIKEHDLVIWQLTTPERFSYMSGNYLSEILLPLRAEKRFIDFFTDEQIIFQQLSLLNIGAMYLRAKKVKFILTSIVSPVVPVETLISEYIKYPEYCLTADCDIDKGTDNLHSGPLSHQKISQLILNHIQYKHE
jgi:hypothetical protein